MIFRYNADAVFENITAKIEDYVKILLSSVIDKHKRDNMHC